MAEPAGYLIPKDYVDTFFAACDREKSRDFGGGPIQGPEWESLKDRRPAAVVCLLETLTSAKPAGAVVMERRADRNIYEVVPTGIVSEGHTDEFGLTINDGTGIRTVYVPYTASAEEFRVACGFDTNVEVCLGGVEVVDDSGGTRFAPIYRWRVMFPDDDSGLIEYSESGAEDAFRQCIVTKDQWFASERLVSANLFYPTPRWPTVTAHSSPAKLEWQNERWEIVREGDPKEGEVFFFTWGKVDWTPETQFAWGYYYRYGLGYQDIVGHAYPILEDGTWYLRNAAETVENPPVEGFGYPVWIVWERGRWKRMVDSNLYRVFSLQYYAYTFGYGAFHWNAGNTGSPGIPAGSLCLLHWTGREWVMSETEQFNFRYLISISKASQAPPG